MTGVVVRRIYLFFVEFVYVSRSVHVCVNQSAVLSVVFISLLQAYE
jgi:hypothetical protein